MISPLPVGKGFSKATEPWLWDINRKRLDGFMSPLPRDIKCQVKDINPFQLPTSLPFSV